MAKKKQNLNLDKHQVEYNPSDFIPYAGHYSSDSIITKNGELMQVIKITGFNCEDISHEKVDLRETIREAISKSVDSNKYAIWLNTLRRRQDLSLKGNYSNQFCEELSNAWVKQNNWENKYINELYVTILIQGRQTSIKSPKDFFSALIPPIETKRTNDFLEKSYSNISKVTENLLGHLQNFGAKKLSLSKDSDGVYHSDIYSFLSKLINLEEYNIPLTTVDASVSLSNHKLRIAHNIVELKKDDSRKRNFGASVTLKESDEIPSQNIDEILQLPMRLNITETFDFINNKAALSSFTKIADTYKISGDKKILQNSHIEDILATNTGKETDFGQHQITVTVIDDDIKSLNEDIHSLINVLNQYGIVSVREDLFLENAYWSQLPGNFEFIARTTYINTRELGSFASLHNFPAGKMKGNHWGDAVAVLPTDIGTPYFFNFHYDDVGHLLLVGPKYAGKTVIMNFLVAKAQKFAPNIYYFDYEHASEIFIKVLGGKYYVLDNNTSDEQINDIIGLIKNSYEKRIFGFDTTNITDIGKKSKTLEALLGAIEKYNDKQRTIVALDEAWELVDNDHFAPVANLHSFAEWLDDFKDNNISVIFATHTGEDIANTQITHQLHEHIKTQIYLPNSNAREDNYKKIFQLNDVEFEAISKIHDYDKQILLRHGSNSIIARMNMYDFRSYLAILSASPDDIALMNMAIEKMGDNPDDWYVFFKQLLSDSIPSEFVI